jgi:general secretion pathway protein G
MLQRIRKTQEEREGGFTLIELLIVIVVLGILAGIVVFGVATFRSDSEEAACKADVKTVSVAADAYNAKWGTYPAGTVNSTHVLVTANYIKAAPATVVTLDATTKKASATCGTTTYSQ